MTLLRRKFKTLANLLHHRTPFHEVSRLAARNLRQLRIFLNLQRPFVYRIPPIGRFVCVPTSHTSVRTYLTAQAYEEAESAIIRAWLLPDDACVDVGANIGIMSVLFATHVRQTGKVVAVEPIPATAHTLRTTIATLRLSNVIVAEACASDRPGAREIMIPLQGAPDISASFCVAPANSARFIPGRVAGTTVDALLAEHNISHRLALLKIDVEGAEPLVLRGAAALLSGTHLPLVLIEANTPALARLGFTPQDICRFLPPDRFDLFCVQRSTSDLSDPADFGTVYPLPDPGTHEWPWYSNLLAVPTTGRYASRRPAIQSLLPATRSTSVCAATPLPAHSHHIL